MKLRTSLQLSAIFPVVFAICAVVMLFARAQGAAVELTLPFMAILGLLGLGMAATILYYSRDILRKIRTLEEWTDAVLMGDLDREMEMEPSDDEVGVLSAGLTRMLRDLKDAYAGVQEQARVREQEARKSKEEAEQWKKGVEVTREAANHVTQALRRLKQTQQAELQRQRSEVLEQAIRGMTHDFSEAMVPIAGTCEDMLQHTDTLDATVAEQVQTIQEGAERAKKLLKSLAGLFHIEEVTAGPTDAATVISDVLDHVDAMRKKAGGEPVRAETELAETPGVAVNEEDLRDAVKDLVTNAIEAMPDGGTVTVLKRSEGSQVVIEVRDTGKGMSHKVKARCLEPFFSTKRTVGVGMGLVKVNNTVQRHGGTLDIQSRPDGGTTVRMILPAWEAVSARQDRRPVSAEAPESLRVLMIDDEPICRTVISHTLTRAGHTVDTASNGKEGLDKIKADAFDVVLVDRAMPDISGDELALMIRDAAWSIPVVMLTGYGGIMTQEGRIPEGVDVVASKPATLEELTRSIANAFVARDLRVAKGKPESGQHGLAVDEGQGAEGGKGFDWIG